MSENALSLACVAFFACSVAAAQGDAKGNEVKPSVIVTGIFSEILVIPYQEGFVGVFARTHNDFYINEMVLKGETVDRWSQMITQTGRKGLSSSPNVSPMGYLNAIAGGIKSHCPDTYAAKAIGATTVSGHDGFIAWTSCGKLAADGSEHSESTLFICIKGTEDYYTVQWAERGPASSQPLVYEDAKWGERLKRLSSVQIVPRAPGEATPHPAVDQK